MKFHILPKNKKLSVKTLTNLLVWAIVIGAIVFLSFFIYLINTIPDPESIAVRKVGESTKIYDSTGQTLLYDIHGEEKRTIIPWDQMPSSIKSATLAAEDSGFYNHQGIDIKGIVRAFYTDIKNLQLSQGGSTITQQLVKISLLGQQKTFARKIREIILSIEVEKKFTKDQIFWMYLNQIPYGSNAYGIEAASETFFNKKASDLSVAEAATLAALPRAPTYYSPYGNHVQDLIARKDFILGRMKDLGYITEEEYNSAKAEQVSFSPSQDNLIAPHFVIMVKDYLESKYGQDAAENGGLKVITTLDTDLQQIAEDVVSKYSKINKEQYQANNSALVAIDPKTGNLLALVGSSDYFDIANEGNFNVATALRQPGSSFKPFAYSVAFEKGYPDSTIVFDSKTEFNPNCLPDASQDKDQYGLDCYHPQNYDLNFRGPVTFRRALAQSLNVPSVKILYLAGINDTIDLAQKMGITTLNNPSNYGLSLVLGGAEVKLVDLTSAYGVFANDGVRNPWHFIEKIEDSNENVLEENNPQPQRVLDSQVSRLVTDILSDNSARAGVFGYNSPLYVAGREIAAKTGTTQDNRDAWVVGYSPSLVVGVWSGNNDNSSMTKAGAGISASGPMWHEFITRALAGTSSEDFPKPNPVLSNKIMLNGDYKQTQDGKQENHTILYYVDRNNPLGAPPSDPTNDDQFKNWEWSVQNYFPNF